jgi:hypothetical protein
MSDLWHLLVDLFDKLWNLVKEIWAVIKKILDQLRSTTPSTWWHIGNACLAAGIFGLQYLSLHDQPKTAWVALGAGLTGKFVTSLFVEKDQ